MGLIYAMVIGHRPAHMPAPPHARHSNRWRS